MLWVDQGSSLMRVQAGMTVKQLLAEATRAGMSVPLGAVPAFADLMLGGVLLTGAHGSAFRGRSHVVRGRRGGGGAVRRAPLAGVAAMQGAWATCSGKSAASLPAAATLRYASPQGGLSRTSRHPKHPALRLHPASRPRPD